MGTEGKRNEAGIFIPLSADEKEQVQQFIEENAPGTPSGRFARTALFYYLHRIEREGYSKILADILGA
jgi:hypothetical protein